MTVFTTSAPAQPAARAAHPDPRVALAASVLGFFVVTLDATVVNVPLPSIRADLGGALTGLQSVVDGYTLMFAALLTAGALTARRGARTARYDPSDVEPMTAGPARAATLRLDPAMTALPTPTRREGD